MSIRKKIILLGSVLLILQSAFGSTTNYRIYITDIQREVYENFLRVPHAVDYTVYWDFYEEGSSGSRKLDVSTITHFRALCVEEGKCADLHIIGMLRRQCQSSPAQEP